MQVAQGRQTNRTEPLNDGGKGLGKRDGRTRNGSRFSKNRSETETTAIQDD